MIRICNRESVPRVTHRRTASISCDGLEAANRCRFYVTLADQRGPASTATTGCQIRQIHFRRSHYDSGHKYSVFGDAQAKIPDLNFFLTCDKVDGNIFKIPDRLASLCGAPVKNLSIKQWITSPTRQLARRRTAIKQSPLQT